MLFYRKGTINVDIIDTPKDNAAGEDSEPSTTWVIKSTNIRRFRFVDSPALQKRMMAGSPISRLVLDGVRFDFRKEDGYFSASASTHGTFLRTAGSEKLWTVRHSLLTADFIIAKLSQISRLFFISSNN